MLRLLRAISVAILFCGCLVQAAGPTPGRFLISGNIVAPQGVIANGWLEIENGRIVQIFTANPDSADLPVLETDDFIFPGFIDLHDHPTFNVFPRWTPPHKFPNRYAWRAWDVYRRDFEDRANALTRGGDSFCDVDEYVEVKALIGGITSMIGFTGHGRAPRILPDCIKGLVRNLDVYTGFYSPDEGHERIVNSIGVTPLDMTAAEAADVKQRISDGKIDLLAIHIAEGLPTDPESAHELDELEAAGLLTAHTTLIHSVGLSPAQLKRVHQAGASIVWSPHSNFELYGVTADVGAAYCEGVTLALAPDWSPTGSDNMLDEIKYAHDVNRDRLEGLFSSRQLVEMASSIPARIAYIDDKVGSLAPGMMADFFLVRPPENVANRNPYDALIASDVIHVDLVVVGGVPVYGQLRMLEALHLKTESIQVCGATRALNVDALPAGSFADVEARLTAKMKAVGASLAPLAECVR
jgi:cytosine/adenosine deaminase-related metal-dependent hydrolase